MLEVIQLGPDPRKNPTNLYQIALLRRLTLELLFLEALSVLVHFAPPSRSLEALSLSALVISLSSLIGSVASTSVLVIYARHPKSGNLH